MEFKVSSKAKSLTLILMILGLAGIAIGVMIELSASHDSGARLTQRFLGNLLIDSFFFFAIGLGALFFLALQYATETGWYASVKRIIEGVAGYLPYGIGLMLITLLISRKDPY
jgi:hypothetical protein